MDQTFATANHCHTFTYIVLWKCYTFNSHKYTCIYSDKVIYLECEKTGKYTEELKKRKR